MRLIICRGRTVLSRRRGRTAPGGLLMFPKIMTNLPLPYPSPTSGRGSRKIPSPACGRGWPSGRERVCTLRQNNVMSYENLDRNALMEDRNTGKGTFNMRIKNPGCSDPRQCKHYYGIPTVREAIGECWAMAPFIAFGWAFFVIYPFYSGEADAHPIFFFFMIIVAVSGTGQGIAFALSELRIAREAEAHGTVIAQGVIIERWAEPAAEWGEDNYVGYQFDYMGNVWIGKGRVFTDKLQIGDSVSVRFLSSDPTVSVMQVNKE